MIGSVSSIAMPPPPPAGGGQSSELTESQSTDLQALLEDYDSENLTEETAQEIVAAVSELGIEPGAALESALSELGFDAQSIGDLAGVGDQQQSGPPPPPAGAIDTEAVTLLQSVLDSIPSDQLSEDDWDLLYQELSAVGFDTSQPLIDVRL